MHPPLASLLRSASLFLLLPAFAACNASDGPSAATAVLSLSNESPNYDLDGDGLGGIYDCDDEDASMPAMCPMAEPEPGRPVWCDDGLTVPESRSLMNWVNQLTVVNGVETGLREYLYDSHGKDHMPKQCDIALLAIRGGPQDANTEQLTRYVIDGAGPSSVGYVLAGRSFWPQNAEDWNFPSHAIDTSCPSADGRTRLRDLHEACSTAITLRRISPWDACGSQYEGKAILVGGGQSADEYPKANLLKALSEATKAGLLGSVNQVVDIDSLHWSNACRAGLGARGCCHVTNRTREHSGHAGVQLLIPTEILTYGPVCKNADDLLHKFECSELSSHAPLSTLGDLLRKLLSQPSDEEDTFEDLTVDDLLAQSPLSDEALISVIYSDLKDKDIIAVLEANRPLSDRVLLAAAEALEQDNRMADLFINSSPLSVAVLLSLIETMQNEHFLGAVLLANSPELPETVMLAVLKEFDRTHSKSEVLLANSPELSDEVLLSAVEHMGRGPHLDDVLRANCPLSATVLNAVEKRLGKKAIEQLAQCQGG